MSEEVINQLSDVGEVLSPMLNSAIVKNWDRTVESLRQRQGLEELVQKLGFDLPTLVATLNAEFPADFELKDEFNAKGVKIEDLGTETITANGREIERLLVVAYPTAANTTLTEMTKFKYGGEVIFVTDGEAAITYAQDASDTVISREGLQSERVQKGDLLIFTDVPNNWTQIFGDKFTFIYFVGNPNGPQVYKAIPKEKIPVV
jgi:hypothetical protein